MAPLEELWQTLHRVLESENASRRRIAALEELRLAAEASLHEEVTRARLEGVTWAVIGEALSVTRQAAFQRFGMKSKKLEEIISPMQNTLLIEAPTHSKRLIEAYAAGRIDELTASFSPEMSTKLTPQSLSQVWRDLSLSFGDVETVGNGSAVASGESVVVDSRVDFEAGAVTCRITWGPDGKVIGLFFRPLHE